MTTKTEDRLIDFMVKMTDEIAIIRTKVEALENSKKVKNQWKMWVIPVILTVFNTVLATYKIFVG